MRIEKSFVVNAPAPAVWAFLTDPQRVAHALPGAAITEQIDPTSYAGTITVKVGPVSTSYRGRMRFERLDPASSTAEIVASGQDVRGKGGAELRMTSRVVQRSAGETEVTVISDVSITGLLAQMGRGMIEDVSNQMFQRFTEAMRTQLEPAATGPSPSNAADVSPVMGATSSAPPRDPVAPVESGATIRPVPRAMARAGAAAPPAAPPIEVLSFGWQMVARALGRAARRPGLWAIIVVLVFVAYWVWVR